LGVFGRAMRQRIEETAMQVRTLPTAQAEAEVGRVARAELAQAGRGLRGLELAATIGPLLGLLGTVTGMIAAFQALQTAGANADPATLAGGIWEALLTTAAGMAVAIPASIALAWFDGIIDRLRHDLEDAASRILLAPVP
jgi:biopolymer transport protein ExbB